MAGRDSLGIANALLSISQAKPGNQHSQQESADVSPPSDASRSSDSNGSDSRHELKQKPIPQDDERRDGNEENEDERDHASAWIKNDIGAHDGGDCAAGSEGRQIRMKVKDNVGDPGTDAANQVKQKIWEVAEVVFHVIPEDPEEKHVSADVKPVIVQEHAGENG